MYTEKVEDSGKRRSCSPVLVGSGIHRSGGRQTQSMSVTDSPVCCVGVVGMCELLMVSVGSVAWRRQALCGRYSPKLGSLGVRSLLPAAPSEGWGW